MTRRDSASSRPGVLAVVIGRGGSRGLPNKNSRIVAGRPMICHTIEDSLEAERVDHVIVSTDGPAIADAARSMGVEVIMRPPELASDTATVDAAVRHAVEEHRTQNAERRNEWPGIVVILYANVPVRPADLIDRAVRTLIDTGADSVQSYSTIGKCHPYWLVRFNDDGRVEPYIVNTVYRRQELPPLFVPDGGVIAVTRRSLLTIVPGQPHAFLGHDRRGIESPPGAVIDVDDEIDLAVAEAMLERSASSAAR